MLLFMSVIGYGLAVLLPVLISSLEAENAQEVFCISVILVVKPGRSKARIPKYGF